MGLTVAVCGDNRTIFVGSGSAFSCVHGFGIWNPNPDQHRPQKEGIEASRGVGKSFMEV